MNPATLEPSVLPHVRRWPVVSGAVLALALALGLVAAHTVWLQPHGLAVDEAIAADWRTPVATSVALLVSALFSPVVGLLTVVTWTGLLLVWRHRPVAAIATLLVVAVGWGSSLVVKEIVARHRPPGALVHALATETGSNSYPSGHVALAFSMATAAWFLARRTRWSLPVATAGVLVVAVVAFSRLYLGVHYPGDVIGSVLVSTSAIVALTGLWHGVIVGRIASLTPLLARFGPPGSDPDPHPGPTAARAAHDAPVGPSRSGRRVR